MSERQGLRDLHVIICAPTTMERLTGQGREGRILQASPSSCLRHGTFVAMKVHSIAGNLQHEARDLPDIERLLTAHGLDWRCEAARQFFVKYGLEVTD